MESDAQSFASAPALSCGGESTRSSTPSRGAAPFSTFRSRRGRRDARDHRRAARRRADAAWARRHVHADRLSAVPRTAASAHSRRDFDGDRLVQFGVVDPPQRKSGQPSRQQLRGGLDLVARYSFTPDGENLIVECWIGAGGGLPEHLHPRQEERWSMMLGRIRLASATRSVRSAPPTAKCWWLRAPSSHWRTSATRRRSCVATSDRRSRFSPSWRKARRRRAKASSCAAAYLAACAARAGRRVAQAPPGGRDDVVSAAAGAVGDDRAAGTV